MYRWSFRTGHIQVNVDVCPSNPPLFSSLSLKACQASLSLHTLSLWPFHLGPCYHTYHLSSHSIVHVSRLLNGENKGTLCSGCVFSEHWHWFQQITEQWGFWYGWQEFLYWVILGHWKHNTTFIIYFVFHLTAIFPPPVRCKMCENVLDINLIFLDLILSNKLWWYTISAHTIDYCEISLACLETLVRKFALNVDRFQCSRTLEIKVWTVLEGGTFDMI